MPVFLPTINHISARNISSSNLTLKATKRYMVRLPGSLFLPLKKMKREIKLIRKKLMVRIATSVNFMFTVARVRRINPETRIRVAKSIRRNKYIFTVPTRVYHFIKSLTDVYIPPKTPRSEKMMVKTGVSSLNTLSSLMPTHVMASIIKIIWNAMPVYFAKSCNPLFSLFSRDFFGFFSFWDWGTFIVFTFVHSAIAGKVCAGFNRKLESYNFTCYPG